MWTTPIGITAPSRMRESNARQIAVTSTAPAKVTVATPSIGEPSTAVHVEPPTKDARAAERVVRTSSTRSSSDPPASVRWVTTFLRFPRPALTAARVWSAWSVFRSSDARCESSSRGRPVSG